VTVERAAELFRSVGMQPLVVRSEIDGFIADRLLEALWREALWLVNDGVATVEEVDDAIRYGAGLRWAFMGTFLTYRIAGGEQGMRHFLRQFGPALEWPWTHLTDVPELTDELVETIAAQSDEQTNGVPARELERLRDQVLVRILQALRAEETGAGATLAAWERGLLGSAPPLAVDGNGAPLRLPARLVPPDWLDYNGHVHESRYLELFADATDVLLGAVGVDAGYLAAGGSYFSVETHLSHLRQLAAGDRVYVTTQVLDSDEKRLHIFHVLLRDGEAEPLATAEQMLLHVDTESGHAAPSAEPVCDRVAELTRRHAELPRPERAGRSIGAR
jgi:carnitine 3-dehydrogenase